MKVYEALRRIYWGLHRAYYIAFHVDSLGLVTDYATDEGGFVVVYMVNDKAYWLKKLPKPRA